MPASPSIRSSTAMEKDVAIHQEDTIGMEKGLTHELEHNGARMIEQELEMGTFSAICKFWRPLLICSISFTASMMFGYDIIVNGASLAMPGFLRHFGTVHGKKLILPSIWTSLWTAMSALSQAVGALSVGFTQDRIGRKWSGVAAAALTIPGTALQYFSNTRSELLGGKIINGFAIGATLAVGLTWASEIAPLRLKGLVQQAIILCMALMMAVALGVVRAFVPDPTPKSFHTVFAIQWAVGGLSTLAFVFAPESPTYLLTHNRTEDARKSMNRIYSPGPETDARFALLSQTVREEQTSKQLSSGSYMDCFKGTDLKRTLIATFVFSSQYWGGAAFLHQSIYVMITAGLPAIHSFDVSIGGFALSAVLLVGSWFIPRVNYRWAFIIGCALNFIGMILIGGLSYVPGKGGLWPIAIIMNVLVGIQAAILQGMGYPLAVSVSSYRLRGKTISIATIFQAVISWIVSFVLPYIYNVGSGNLGTKTGFIFMATSLIMLALAWLYVPNLTGMTEREINNAFEIGAPLRKFHHRALSEPEE